RGAGVTMSPMLMYILIAVLSAGAIGGAVFAFAGGGETSKKRMAAVSKPRGKARGGKGGNADNNQSRRKNVQVMLKELENQQAAKKQRISLRRRIETAGLEISVPSFWIMSAGCGVAVAVALYFLVGTHVLVALLAGFAAGVGLPRWVLSFLKARREK